MRPVLETLTVPPFGENTYLFGDADAGVAVVIDPGGRADEIVGVAARRGVAIHAIVNTHAHIDHIGGVAALQARTGGGYCAAHHRRHLLAAGQTIAVGGLSLTVRHTPGHAPGHVTLGAPTLTLDGRTAPVAFCGDVIFMGSVGRTDLPGGDHATLMTSIAREILTLPDETVLYPGHGPATTVGRERRTNPFVLDWLRRPGTA